MYMALFLDRDGVLIENRPDYVRSWAQVEIFPQALQALARAAQSAYKIVLITNQAGIGRGLILPEVAEEINRRLVAEVVKAGGRIDGVYLCPHKPEDSCECRKPRPGLILQAARELDLDLKRSIFIGDALTDLQAGQAAGINRLALVSTGRGKEQAQLLEDAGLIHISIYEHLGHAIEELLLQAT
jgi:D-glycero-D-manno-heptose 1,7-bisphosphate phosphatase